MYIKNVAVRHVDSEEEAESEHALLEAQALPLADWRQAHVRAWVCDQLGAALDERQRRLIADNVKSGKVLASLTDAELTHSLHITHPLLLRRMRTAIDDLRHAPQAGWVRLSR